MFETPIFRNVVVKFKLFDGSTSEMLFFSHCHYTVGEPFNSIQLRILGKITTVEVVDPNSSLVLHVDQVGAIKEEDARFFEEHLLGGVI